MPAKAMSAEDLEEQRLRMAEVAKRKRSVLFQMDEKTAQYELYFSLSFKTNGGMMFDITVTYDSKETRHRWGHVSLAWQGSYVLPLLPELGSVHAFRIAVRPLIPADCQCCDAEPSCQHCGQQVVLVSFQRVTWHIALWVSVSRLPVTGMLTVPEFRRVQKPYSVCVACLHGAWVHGAPSHVRHGAMPAMLCRIIVGREYYEGSGFEPETVIEMLVTFLLQKKVPRQTEGEAPRLLGGRALPAARVCRMFAADALCARCMSHCGNAGQLTSTGSPAALWPCCTADVLLHCGSVSQQIACALFAAVRQVRGRDWVQSRLCTAWSHPA